MDITLQRILELLGDKHGAVKSLADGIDISPNIISNWKNGTNKSYSKYQSQIAEYYGVSLDWLSGNSDNKKPPLNKSGGNAVLLEDTQLVRFPIVGSISAGYNCLAVEEYTGDFELIPFAGLRGSPNDYFVLRVSGDSMYPRLLDGDRVLVRRTNTVENEKVAVVLYNGDEATIKKVNYAHGKALELIPYNPEYKIKRIEGVDLEQCCILGEVVQLIRNM